MEQAIQETTRLEPKSAVRVVKVVGSHVVTSLEYNYDKQRLTVVFAKTGSVWQYDLVPAEIFGIVVSSPSIGAAFNKYVRGNYDGARINLLTDTV